MTSTARLLAIAVALNYLAVSSTARAELLAYEPFDYPNDEPMIVGRTGSFGWDSEGWIGESGAFDILSQDDSSLESPVFPFTPAGDRAIHSPDMVSTRVQLPASNTIIDMSQEGGVAYFSLLWTKDQDGASSGDNIEFDLASPTTTQTVRAGSTSGDQFFLNDSSNTGDAVNFGETYFFVLKLEAHDIDPDQVSLAIFGESDQVPASENDVVWDLTDSPTRTAQIDRVRVWFGRNTMGAMDEIRVGTTYESVTSAMTSLLGDFDDDGDVDGSDFLQWQQGFGDAFDASDLVDWEENFGGPASAIAAVPEPATMLLIFPAALAIICRRQAR